MPKNAIEAPRLIGEALVEYPASGAGDHEVVLELLVTSDGSVSEAQAVQGSEPFASAAESAATRFRFEPARREGRAVTAKIRFLVTFTDPVKALESAPSPEPPPDPEMPAPVVVRVLGDREPLAHTLTRAEVRQLPGAFGDPFRAIEALPGVTPVLSGVPFFYVRGAPPGNVGYFLDGMRLPLLYHVGLGPSVVHPAMVSRVDLYPGAYPTRYGRFSGGIVAGEITEPPDAWRGEWQLRIFDAGAMVEAPIFGGRGHVLVGGRYSYTAYLIALLGEDARLEYWDYQLRASYAVGDNDTLGVFFFGSFDYFGEDTPADDDGLFSTEFHRLDLRHRHDFASGAALRTALTWGFDRTRVGEDVGAAINRRWQLRSVFNQPLSPDLELELGADVALDRYGIDVDFEAAEGDVSDLDDEGQQERDEEEEQFRRLFPGRRDTATGAYAELRWDADPTTRLTGGLRFDAYASAGATAYSIEPRVSAEFRITPELSLENAFGLAAQPPSFVLPVAGFEIGGLPGGLQRSVQSSAGAIYRLPDGMKLELTLFHNAFFNMTDPLALARVELPEDEDDLQPDSRTRGQAYGVELMFHRDLTRKLGGFLSYTLSRSVRSSFRGTIPASFDRTHVLNAVLAYDLGWFWRAGGRFVFYTGNPQFSLAEPSRRLPPYHRLDVRLEKRWPIGSAGAYWAFVIEVLNTTLSTEVVASDCDVGVCENEEIGPIIIPSLSFEGRF